MCDYYITYKITKYNNLFEVCAGSALFADWAEENLEVVEAKQEDDLKRLIMKASREELHFQICYLGSILEDEDNKDQFGELENIIECLQSLLADVTHSTFYVFVVSGGRSTDWHMKQFNKLNLGQDY